MSKHQRLILGLGHYIGAGVLLFGMIHAKTNSHPLVMVLFAGGVMGMLMLGMIWMSGDLD